MDNHYSCMMIRRAATRKVTKTAQDTLNQYKGEGDDVKDLFKNMSKEIKEI